MLKSNDPIMENLSPAEHKHLMAMIKSGVSRRDFMGYMMAMGATIAASGAMFASLSDAWAQTPRRGGKLILAGDQHGPADTLDPTLFTSAIDYLRGRMVYNSLTRLTDSLGYEPELAEEVLPNENATQWTFKLRRGIQFHDGKEFNADDVIYSMNRHIGEGNTSKASALVDTVESWEKVNEYEVRANLSSPNADLPIALGTFHFKIVKAGQEDFSNPAGTGPFSVTEFKPGVRIIVNRNDSYWEDGAYLDEIEHFGIGDKTARLNAFLAGDVDGMINVDPLAIPTIEATPGRDIWALEAARYTNIAPRHDHSDSNNPDLWRAMQHLQDRERMVRGVFKGQGSIANDHPIGAAYFDHSPDIPQRQLDPDMAKFHFDRSGIGTAPIVVSTGDVAPGAVDQCLFMQREGAKIGMNIEVNKVTVDGYWNDTWLVAPIAVATWNMRPTANVMMTLAFKSDAAWNETRWQNPQFDQLLVEVRGVTDPAMRRQMYHDLQMMIYEGNGMAIPAFSNYIDGIASKVKGRTFVPLNNYGGAESPRTLWIDDSV